MKEHDSSFIHSVISLFINMQGNFSLSFHIYYMLQVIMIIMDHPHFNRQYPSVRPILLFSIIAAAIYRFNSYFHHSISQCHLHVADQFVLETENTKNKSLT
jgi:hypothetical protein